jgi:CRP/FNR family cyclic AMP-dependent transcriptional regulator
MTTPDLLEELRDADFLGDLPDGCLRQLASIADRACFSEGDIIFRQGEAAAQAHVLTAGNVSLEVCAAGLGCQRLMTVGPGELLGWSPLLGDTRLTATARTLEPTTTIVLDGGRLRALCDADPRLGYELMRRTARALAQRLSATRMQLLDVFGDEPPRIPQVAP